MATSHILYSSRQMVIWGNSGKGDRLRHNPRRQSGWRSNAGVLAMLLNALMDSRHCREEKGRRVGRDVGQGLGRAWRQINCGSWPTQKIGTTSLLLIWDEHDVTRAQQSPASWESTAVLKPTQPWKSTLAATFRPTMASDHSGALFSDFASGKVFTRIWKRWEPPERSQSQSLVEWCE